MRASQAVVLGCGAAFSALAIACSLGLDSSEFAGGVDDVPPAGDAAAGDDVNPGDDSAAAADAFASSEAGDGDAGPAAPPCKTAGDRCPDGTILAESPSGGASSASVLFTTPCDFGQTVDGKGCSGARIALAFNDGNADGGVFVGATSFENGADNTSKLVAADSDIGVGGVQPHRAAKACADLVAHGHDDWYLPAADELGVLYTNRNAIGAFVTTGDTAPFYKSSTETHDATQPLNAARLRFTDGYLYLDGDSKPLLEVVRCVRKAAL